MDYQKIHDAAEQAFCSLAKSNPHPKTSQEIALLFLVISKRPRYTSIKFDFPSGSQTLFSASTWIGCHLSAWRLFPLVSCFFSISLRSLPLCGLVPHRLKFLLFPLCPSAKMVLERG